MPRIVVIGGVAAGMSAASQAKRREPKAEVVVFERGPYVSYGACGMPYNIQDPARDIEDLVVISPERFRTERGIEVRTGHEVVAILRAQKKVSVRAVETGKVDELAYDELIIATGASPMRPPLPGIELPGVMVLRDLQDGRAMKRFLDEVRPRSVVVIGAGYIGMEMADVLRQRGLAVTVIEKLPDILPGYEPEITRQVRAELTRRGVSVQVDVATESIEPGGKRDSDGLIVRTSAGLHTTDMVIVSVGVRPNVALAQAAGLVLGPTGAIAVDAELRTNDPHIFAAGDCAEAHHRVLDAPAYVPLGSTANKQGKIAGANAVGAHERFAGIVGTAGFRVFDLEVARTGLGQSDIDRLGLKAVRAASTHQSKAHGYPGAKPLTTVVFAEKGTGRLLGAQMVGADVVAKRIDVFATALTARMAMDAIEELDLAYAPPFAPVYDPVLIAATVTLKELAKAGRG
ncbi:MAG: FAD-dependent oxidoreductase [Myxococcota bacterium]